MSKPLPPRTPSRRKAAAVFRRAAQGLERSDPDMWDYPCWHIATESGLERGYWSESKNAEVFLSMFSDKGDMREMSDEFLENMDIVRDRDSCIVALCFAAAIAERP